MFGALQILLQFPYSIIWQYFNGEKKIKQQNLTDKFNFLVADVVSATWIATLVCKKVVVKVVPQTTPKILYHFPRKFEVVYICHKEN